MKTTCLIILLILLSGGTALAHKINVFAWVEDGNVVCESYFPDGRPLAAARVTVRDGRDTVLLTGETAADGTFRFPRPSRAALTIVVTASMGHQASFTLKESDPP